jgi:hypothetical protein
MKCKTCLVYYTWLCWGLRQLSTADGTMFTMVDVYLCEHCCVTSLIDRDTKNYPPIAKLPNMAYCSFVLNRNTALWPERESDIYDEYAKKHGISRLHAIHELDGA